jgi:hypothetical protein
MKTRTAAPLLVGALALWATAVAPRPARAEDTYALKRVYKAGETDRYKTVMTMEAETPQGAMKVETTMVMSHTTREMKEDGTVVVVRKVESGTINFNGMERPLPTVGQETTLTLDKTGKVVKQEGGDPPGRPGFGRMLNLTNVNVYPDHPLKIDEEWKFEFQPEEESKEKVKGILKILGVEPKSDEVPAETLKVNIKMEVPVSTPQGNTVVKVDVTTLVEKETGKELKSDGTVTGVQFGPVEPKINIKRTRVKDETK